MPKSPWLTSWLFFAGGSWGFHHLYLENYAEAILYSHTLAGCGLMWVLDLCRLKQLAAGRAASETAPLQWSRLACQYIVASWYAHVAGLPCTVFVTDVSDLENMWLRLLGSIVVALAAAAGAVAVGNCGSQRCPYVLNAIITSAAVIVIPVVLLHFEIENYSTFVIAALSATAIAALSREPRPSLAADDRCVTDDAVGVSLATAATKSITPSRSDTASAPLQLFRVACQYFVASFYANVGGVLWAMFEADLSAHLHFIWLRLLGKAVVSVAAAAGAFAVGSYGSQRCPFLLTALLTSVAVAVTAELLDELDVDSYSTYVLAALIATAAAAFFRQPRNGLTPLPQPESLPVERERERVADGLRDGAAGSAEAVNGPPPPEVEAFQEVSTASVSMDVNRSGSARHRSIAGGTQAEPRRRPPPPGTDIAPLPGAHSVDAKDSSRRRRPAASTPSSPARRCCRVCCTLAVQCTFWLFLLCSAALHVELRLVGTEAAAEEEPTVETHKIGELLWRHRSLLWRAVGQVAGVESGGPPLWADPGLRETWEALLRGQADSDSARRHSRGGSAGRGSSSSGGGRSWTDGLRQWASGGGESVSDLLRQLRMEPQQGKQGGSRRRGWAAAEEVPPVRDLRSAHRAAALELHPDRLPPGASQAEHEAAAAAFERMQRAYERLLALRRRQDEDAVRG